MRGDKVEVLVDTGDGGVRGFEIVATRSGRRVEVTTSRTMVEVAEVTRTGQPVRTARFLSSRVVAIVEHPYDGGGPAAAGRRLRPLSPWPGPGRAPGGGRASRAG